MQHRTLRTVSVFLALSITPLHAQAPQAGFSTFGMPGMIDMPTARVFPDGALGFSITALPGTQRATLSFQALPRVTLSFRYASISEWLPGVRTWDRSFDLHWQIREESRFLPALALGLRDFVGTGGYSGEYVVATRSFGPRLNASLGMGWGRLGPVDVHFRRMMVAAMEMKAPKLSSVLQHRVAMPLYSLSFPKKFSIRCRHL